MFTRGDQTVEKFDGISWEIITTLPFTEKAVINMGPHGGKAFLCEVKATIHQQDTVWMYDFASNKFTQSKIKCNHVQKCVFDVNSQIFAASSAATTLYDQKYSRLMSYRTTQNFDA